MKIRKKQVIPWIPYIVIALYSTKISQAWRCTPGITIQEKLAHINMGFSSAFAAPLPSFYPVDLLLGILITACIKLAVYLKGKNAKKYRHNMEYGSARWGTHEDIAPYINSKFRNNVILTASEFLTMESRPKIPKYARNKNVLIVGGSGSGKTRFFVKPNLMQCHSSYVVTDPKGSVLVECGKLLKCKGYRIMVLNTINFGKSMHYNPFAYSRSFF